MGHRDGVRGVCVVKEGEGRGAWQGVSVPVVVYFNYS